MKAPTRTQVRPRLEPDIADLLRRDEIEEEERWNRADRQHDEDQERELNKTTKE